MVRKYGTKKTTTKQGKAEYMRQYMKPYRQAERELLNRAKREFGITNGRRKPKQRGKR